MTAMKSRSLVPTALLLLFAAPALAEEAAKPGVKIIRQADKVVVRKRTVIDFNDVTVQGELTKPEGSYLLERGRTRFESLIRMRENFDPELRKLAEDREAVPVRR
jgi:hypothetical protein